MKKREPRRDGAGASTSVVLAAIGGVLALALIVIALKTFIASDDLQVVIAGEPNIVPKVRLTSFDVSGNHVMTFSNAGTRPAAVVSVKLVVVDAPPEANCDTIPERTMGASYLDYEFEPLVVQPQQIAVRKVALKKAGNAWPVFEPMFANASTARIRMIGCFLFETVVPGLRSLKWLPAFDGAFNRDGTGGSTQVVNGAVESLLRQKSLRF